MIVVNAAPVAVNDEVATAAATAVDVDVITNDFDPNGDPLTVTPIRPNNNPPVAAADATRTAGPPDHCPWRAVGLHRGTRDLVPHCGSCAASVRSRARFRHPAPPKRPDLEASVVLTEIRLPAGPTGS